MSDRNLLFVVLALQNRLVRKSDMLEAMNIWITAKHRPIADIIVDCGMMRPDDRQLLDALIDRQIANDGSVEDSLAALDVSSSIEHFLKSVADPDVQKSLSHVGARANGERTGPYQPTPAGLRYRVLRPHAKGGLGEVFVAEDTEVHRHVALKEMQEQHAADPASRARFQLEAEITGRLKHPGVVPVYGLGQYADGRPFYAMRFIKGDNLKDAITRFYETERSGRESGEQRLAFRQLLRRFIDVCNAVAYAHSRGVLHRDIKPGNIMLGKYGETLVVDWGLAKVAGRTPTRSASEAADDTEETTLRPSSGSNQYETIPGVAFGTPAFMSPEQAAGKLDELGPASDTYSLGATLYVLLTSQVPFEEQEIDPLLQKVQHGDFPAPRQIRPGTPPASDAICRKAMALKPADRYASALALAADVEHWLADEPVAAYPEPWHERARRWMRRHRTLVTSAAMGLVMSVALLSGATLLLNAAREREQKAKLDANELRADAEKSANEAQLALAKSETLMSLVLDTVDPNQLQPYGSPRFINQFERLETLMDMDTAVPRLTRHDREVASTNAFDGILAHSDMDLIKSTESRKARVLGSMFRKLTARCNALLGDDLASRSKVMDAVGQVYVLIGAEESTAILQAALETRSKALGPSHPDTIRTMGNLASAHFASKNYEHAAEVLEGALSKQIAIIGPNHSDTLTTISRLAQAYVLTNRFIEASWLLEDTLLRVQAALGSGHADALYVVDCLAHAYEKEGRLADALRLRSQYLEMHESTFGKSHPFTLLAIEQLGLDEIEESQFRSGLTRLEQILSIQRQHFKREHKAPLETLENIVMICEKHGLLLDAIRHRKELLEIRRQKLGMDHFWAISTLDKLVAECERAGRLVDVDPILRAS